MYTFQITISHKQTIPEISMSLYTVMYHGLLHRLKVSILDNIKDPIHITLGKCSVKRANLEDTLLMEISLLREALDCSENDLDSVNSISKIGLL